MLVTATTSECENYLAENTILQDGARWTDTSTAIPSTTLSLHNIEEGPSAMAPLPPPTSIHCHGMLTPTPKSISLKYLAEGAANVVFSISAFSTSDQLPPFDLFTEDGKPWECVGESPQKWILRVSKGLRNTPDSLKVKEDFETYIRPLFFSDHESNFLDHLLPLTAVSLHSMVVARLNAEIAKHSARGTLDVPLTDGQWAVGLLMDNMSSEPGQSLTIEIKPKWLAQSPNAPLDSNRCRTCALRALRKSKTSQHDKVAYVCPLYFSEGNVGKIKALVRHKVHKEMSKSLDKPLHPRVETQVVKAMALYLASGEGFKLLSHLKTMQKMLDPNGVLSGEHFPPDPSFMDQKRLADHNLRLAMTLRDCSMFVKATFCEDDKVAKVEVKLGDLDLKSADKITEWAAKERSLIDGLYYQELNLLDELYSKDSEDGMEVDGCRGGREANHVKDKGGNGDECALSRRGLLHTSHPEN